MVKKFAVLNVLLLLGMVVMLGSAIAPYVFAAEEAEGETIGAEGRNDTSVGEGVRVAGIALAAGLAILGGALGTGTAQAAIGAAGTGALAEKPELFVNVLILVALPETIIVLAFVISFLILQDV